LEGGAGVGDFEAGISEPVGVPELGQHKVSIKYQPPFDTGNLIADAPNAQAVLLIRSLRFKRTANLTSEPQDMAPPTWLNRAVYVKERVRLAVAWKGYCPGAMVGIPEFLSPRKRFILLILQPVILNRKINWVLSLESDQVPTDF
jgi:hypothetical protein